MTSVEQSLPQTNYILRAAAWMSGAVFSFTAMAIAGRALSGDYDTFEIMTYRSIVGVVLVVSLGWYSGTLKSISTNHFKLQLMRNIVHFTGQNLWFFALPLIPLAQLFALEFTTPIWVIVMAVVFLGERLTLTRLMATTLGFIGVLMVAKPGVATIDIGLITAALAAVGFAATAIFTKMLTQRTDMINILFYLTVTQVVFGFITAGYDGDMAPPTLAALPWLTLVGCAGLFAHFCMTRALAIAPASVVTPFDFARLPIIAVIGMMFYNEPLDLLALIGAAVVFAANYINIKGEGR
ncbi:DMT family transporter [Cochlodiniinecator piscidefendens]|uniref:DMT family transporter n=1 Tax=Cochlodiniinecator piscidefendens TaxID=2715756 RepID=UPI001407B1EF|nr:DMT family transporter [Cochlodiniinecator piscidefendens]